MATKAWAILEIDLTAIESNSVSKDSFQTPVKILFLHNDEKTATVEFVRLLNSYPKDRFDVRYIPDSTIVEIINIQKVSSWTGSYRPNKKEKTLCLCSYEYPTKSSESK